MINGEVLFADYLIEISLYIVHPIYRGSGCIFKLIRNFYIYKLYIHMRYEKFNIF